MASPPTRWTASSISKRISAIRCEPNAANCAGTKDGVARHDAVGYHTAEEIPNYWAYAQKFVLQDRLFASIRSQSWPNHLDLTSEWVARCTGYAKASTCITQPNSIAPVAGVQLPWVTLFQLLDTKNVSWKYYLGQGSEPDCDDDEMTCAPRVQTPQCRRSGIRRHFSLGSRRRGRILSGFTIRVPCAFFTTLRRENCPKSRGSCPQTPTASIRRKVSRAGWNTSPR